jgi:protein associated with RNAse G/E
MSSDVVRVQYRKYDGRQHRDYPAVRLAEDECGTWLGVAAGTPSVYHGRPSVEAIPFVLLVPPEAWWTAMFNPRPRSSEVYCDITSVAHWESTDEVHLIDLDLDVVRRRFTGRVELLDEDEFAENRISFGYPDELVTQAYTAAYWLRDALADGTEPFASAYRRWLIQVDRRLLEEPPDRGQQADRRQPDRGQPMDAGQSDHDREPGVLADGPHPTTP